MLTYIRKDELRVSHNHLKICVHLCHLRTPILLSG